MNNDHFIRLDNVFDYNKMMGAETLHPLVSVINFEEMSPICFHKMSMGFYAIFLKQVNCGNIIYGRQYYDYQDGTLVCLAPNQVYGIETNGEKRKPQGYALLFHPDIIKGTPLGRNIQNYTFFSYKVNEALHTSEKEREIVIDCMEKIKMELQQTDKHSKTLISSNIELLLNYCDRFYDRQFITRSNVNKDLLTRFENILNSYFSSEEPKVIGLPSVAYCADKLNISANYFGDLIKKETGLTAQEQIQDKLIDVAKERIFDRSKSVSEIAYELGFKYPQHFTRVFKKRVGVTPVEYRQTEEE